jgi:4-hydroxythreonine-4-phosphate dehydrogenase
VLRFYQQKMDLSDFSFKKITHLKEINDQNIYLIDGATSDPTPQPGRSTKKSGRLAVRYLKQATNDWAKGPLDALVTAPVDKSTIQTEIPDFIGHTEYLAQAANTSSTLMMMVSPDLRVGLVTGHIPLKEVTQSLTQKQLKTKLRLLHRTLQEDFGHKNPQIAVLGLNPHAGDKGLLGQEEKSVITPTIKDFTRQYGAVEGPFSPDGFFGAKTFKHYDAVLGMYHDQVLPAFKLHAFNKGVNFTAGLPKVRTSPDHGPAFALAGTGKAHPGSFTSAFDTGLWLAKQRQNSSS